MNRIHSSRMDAGVFRIATYSQRLKNRRLRCRILSALSKTLIVDG